MFERSVGVLGARSLVGHYLLPRLRAGGDSVTAFTRQRLADSNMTFADATWVELPDASPITPGTFPLVAKRPLPDNPFLISLAPIWVLPQYLPLFIDSGLRRVIALSSTSRFSKTSSSSTTERQTAERLARAEDEIIRLAEARGVAWTILRPTLIYGAGMDRNIAEIARFIRRFGFFPLAGAASGLRQPVHAEEVSSACIAALSAEKAVNRAYDISGAETLSYREMLVRVFDALGKSPRFLPIPLPVFRGIMRALALLPRYRSWTPEMAERMNVDLVFDNQAAVRDWGFNPQPFRPQR